MTLWSGHSPEVLLTGPRQRCPELHPRRVDVMPDWGCTASAVCRPRKVVRMKLSRLGTGPHLATRPAPRWSRTVIFPMTVAVFAGSIALCGASGASALPSSPVTASLTKPAAPKIYMQRSGTGNKEIASIMVPPKSSVVWRFDCQNAPKQRGTFVLSSTEQGRSADKLTDQTGLGGGGQKPFMQSGRYSFGVNTSCGWTVTVESTPLPAGK